MADIYYDGELGSNSTGNGSQGNPYQFPINAHGAAGDTFYLRRGKTHMLNYIYGWTPRMASSPSGLRTKVKAWGEAQIPHAIIDNSHATGPTINISGAPTGRANLDFEDMWVLGTGHTSYPIYVHCYTAELEDINLRRCKVTGKASSAKDGLNIASDAPELYINRRITIEDCEFYDNGGHGTLTTSAMGVTFRRCKSSRNGQTTGAHGFSSFKTRMNITSGWSVQLGNVYKRTMTEITQAGTDISDAIVMIGSLAGTYARLTKLASTADQTAPAPGQFGFTKGAGTGILYVNLNGTDPATQTLNVAYGTLTGLSYEYCDAWGNFAVSGYSYHEGHGIALDDFTGQSRIIGCRSWGNEGQGISVNRGDDNLVSGCVIYDNLWPALSFNRARNNRAVNNIAWNNNLATTHNGFTNGNVADLIASSMATGNQFINNIVRKNNRAYGIQFDGSSTGGVATSNYLEGTTARVTGVTETSPDFIDPAPWMNADGSIPALISVGGIPMPNPLRNAGTYVQGAVLRNGRAQPGMTPIGAYQVGRY